MLEKELAGDGAPRRSSATVFVCPNASPIPRLNASMEQLVPRLEFLPDAMAIEAETLANPEFAHQFF